MQQEAGPSHGYHPSRQANGEEQSESYSRHALYRIGRAENASRTPADLDALRLTKRPCQALEYLAEEGNALLPFSWNPVIRSLLQGTRSQEGVGRIPLTLLRDHETTLLPLVCSFLGHPYANRVRLTLPADLVLSPSDDCFTVRRVEGFSWDKYRLIDYHDLPQQRSPYAKEGIVAFSTVAQVDHLFPPPADRNVNMMPFTLGVKSSLPSDLQCYFPMIDACPYLIEDLGKVAYLTIQESHVAADATQRRPGLHVESPGVFPDPYQAKEQGQGVHQRQGQQEQEQGEQDQLVGSKGGQQQQTQTQKGQYSQQHQNQQDQKRSSSQRERQNWRCARCTFLNTLAWTRCAMCDDESDEADESERISGGEFTSAALEANRGLGGLKVQQAAKMAGTSAPGGTADPPGVSFTPAEEHPWGGGAFYGPDRYEGGIYIASSVGDTTKLYDALVDLSARGIVDRHGGCEHLRRLLGPGTKLSAGELVWLTDCTPHESIPQARSGVRQFFRLVMPSVSHWYADHSTANPRVPLPDHVKVVYGSKFDALGPTFDASAASKSAIVYESMDVKQRMKAKEEAEERLSMVRDPAVSTKRKLVALFGDDNDSSDE